MEYIILAEVGSTNTYCKEHSEELEAPTLVRAVAQTAGRGQRGNYWESSPGENLTFSIVWNPEGVAPIEQFSISEATSLGVVAYLKGRGIEAKVKWPNDIYVGDRKICGILIEHSVAGTMLQRSVIGAGINVNQKAFVSDAPNPVSMSQLTGKGYGIEEEMAAVASEIERYLRQASTGEGRHRLHEEFLASLWRGDGEFYPFRERESGLTFRGRIEGVEPVGFLHVKEETSGETRKYAFKEVEFIL